MHKREHFNVDIEQNIINLYMQILIRQPTSQELLTYTRKISSGKMTIDGLRQRLIDSEEYNRIIKLQSNDLTPELPKMISDKDMLSRIAQIYQEERGNQEPTILILPLRDAYIKLDYNEYALRAMLRDQNYSSFEEEIQTTQELDSDQLNTIFAKYFKVDDLQTKGMQIYDESGQNAPEGAKPSDNIPRTIYDTDSDLSSTLSQINTQRQGVQMNDNYLYSVAQTEVTKDPTQISPSAPIRIPIHKNDMVLIPELAWSVPNYRPPVCTSLGQSQLVQPVLENSHLLLGTPLKDASTATSIGSIMPQFEYKEYVTM